MGTSLFSNRNFYYGDIVQFYKRSLLDSEFKAIHNRRYLYTIICTCYNIETKTNEVIYQSLETGEMFSVSEEAFCEKCDPELESNQEYIFEKFPMGV